MQAHRLRRTLAGVGLAATAAVAAVQVPAHADDWYPSTQAEKTEHNGAVFKSYQLWYNDYKTVYSDLLQHYRPRDPFFRGKPLTRKWRTWPDGTKARVLVRDGEGPYFRYVELSRKGKPYLTQIPRFDGNTATWQPFTARRPQPIKGKVRFTTDVYKKTRGWRPQWDCSIYYKEVCRWDPGRKAKPLHIINTYTKVWRIDTEIEDDWVDFSLGLGTWTGNFADIPSEFTSNPLLPIYDDAIDDICPKGSNVCSGVVDPDVQVTRTVLKTKRG